MTTEEFITKARAIHGDKYDYSKVEYVNANSKVCISCPEHGEFWQRAFNHIAGIGCPKCARERNKLSLTIWTYEKCFKEAKRYTKTSDFMLYSKSAYSAATKHGWLKNFDWLKHKINNTKEKKKREQYTTEKIIDRIKAIYGETYDYSYVNYKTMKTPVTLYCKCLDKRGIEHGLFQMRPDNIFSLGQGCPKCGIDKRNNSQRLSPEEFIQRAKKLHGEKYDYSKIKYLNYSTKVEILCSAHGSFWQTPLNHLSGKGCPFCSGNYKKWTRVTCRLEALKYNYLHDFRYISPGAYNKAYAHGWIFTYDWLKHLPSKDEDYLKSSKYIYVYEFQSFRTAYVGLTNSIIHRDFSHRSKKNSSVYKFAQSNRVPIPQPKILEKEIPILESGEREHYWELEYEKNGWHVLNRAKTGSVSSSLGCPSPLKWNRKTVQKLAIECQGQLKVFIQKYPGAYAAMLKRYREYLDSYFPNRLRHPHISIEDAIQIAQQSGCKNRSHLSRKYHGAYMVLKHNNKLDELFPPKHQPIRSEKEALVASQQYASIEKIRKQNYALWKYLKDHNLFKVAKPTDARFRRCHTIEEAMEISQYYRTMTELSNHAKLAYRILKANDLLKVRYPDSKVFLKK